MAQDRLKPVELVVIGGSAGSLEVLLKALPALEAEGMPALVIVLHRRSGDDSALTDLFSSKTSMPVKEASDKETIEAATIYLAPPDYHLLIEKDRTLSLDYSEKVNHSRPSIDVTFQTAADAYGAALCLVLLSGASDDGSEGLRIAGESGALLVVQDPATAEVAYMPQQAISRQQIDKVIPGEALAGFLNSLV